MERIKRKMTMLLLGAAVLLFWGGTQVKAAGGSSSLSVSASTVNIGDTVTVTLNVSSNVYASFRMGISYSSGVLEYTGSDKSGDCNGGGGALSVLSEVSGGSTYSVRCTFKAIAPGTASVSASAVEAIAMETAEAISISGSGTSISVNNAATDSGGGTGGGEENNGGGSSAPLSGDNSLRSLTISPGSLSPAFVYNNTKYTATVGGDVTNIAVDAQVSNEKATVESVSGNTDLQPGANAVQVVVKAENGTVATYTITVTRGGAGAETPEEEEPGEENPEETQEPEEEVQNQKIVVNGVEYVVSETLPEQAMPEEFTRTTIDYEGKNVEVYTFPYGDLVLYYLTPVQAEGESSEAEGGFFFYQESEKQFFPYVKILVGEKYVLVLPAAYAEEAAPQGYPGAAVTIGGFPFSGYQLGVRKEEQEEGTGEFYLVYGVDQQGTAGWYRYDSKDVSLQRFAENIEEITEETEEPQAGQESYQADYEKLKKTYEAEKSSAKIRTIILGSLLAAAVVVIAVVSFLAIKGKGGRNGRDKELDFIDFDDL